MLNYELSKLDCSTFKELFDESTHSINIILEYSFMYSNYKLINYIRDNYTVVLEDYFIKDINEERNSEILDFILDKKLINTDLKELLSKDLDFVIEHLLNNNKISADLFKDEDNFYFLEENLPKKTIKFLLNENIIDAHDNDGALLFSAFFYSNIEAILILNPYFKNDVSYETLEAAINNKNKDLLTLIFENFSFSLETLSLGFEYSLTKNEEISFLIYELNNDVILENDNLQSLLREDKPNLLHKVLEHPSLNIHDNLYELVYTINCYPDFIFNELSLTDQMVNNPNFDIDTLSFNLNILDSTLDNPDLYFTFSSHCFKYTYFNEEEYIELLKSAANSSVINIFQDIYSKNVFFKDIALDINKINEMIICTSIVNPPVFDFIINYIKADIDLNHLFIKFSRNINKEIMSSILKRTDFYINPITIETSFYYSDYSVIKLLLDDSRSYEFDNLNQIFLNVQNNTYCNQSFDLFFETNKININESNKFEIIDIITKFDKINSFKILFELDIYKDFDFNSLIPTITTRTNSYIFDFLLNNNKIDKVNNKNNNILLLASKILPKHSFFNDGYSLENKILKKILSFDNIDTTVNDFDTLQNLIKLNSEDFIKIYKMDERSIDVNTNLFKIAIKNKKYKLINFFISEHMNQLHFDSEIFNLLLSISYYKEAISFLNHFNLDNLEIKNCIKYFAKQKCSYIHVLEKLISFNPNLNENTTDKNNDLLNLFTYNIEAFKIVFNFIPKLYNLINLLNNSLNKNTSIFYFLFSKIEHISLSEFNEINYFSINLKADLKNNDFINQLIEVEKKLELQNITVINNNIIKYQKNKAYFIIRILSYFKNDKEIYKLVNNIINSNNKLNPVISNLVTELISDKFNEIKIFNMTETIKGF